MVGDDEKGLFLGWVGPLLLLGLLTPVAASAAPGPVRLEILEGAAGSPASDGLALAVRTAGRKLESPQCREVFSEFRDANGIRIADRLAALGQSPATYLSLVVFYEGHGYSRCDSRATYASTSPGSRAVYICSPQFLQKQRDQPGYAAVLIIHEELHSLGLGEDPPTSKQITSAVIARCGL
jgi:hypothetical protein